MPALKGLSTCHRNLNLPSKPTRATVKKRLSLLKIVLLSQQVLLCPFLLSPVILIGKCKENLRSLNQTEQLEALSQMFRDFGQLIIPSDFLELTRKAVHNLKEEGRANLIYMLARCRSTKRVDGSDTLLPVKRMPTGLIEYVVTFFNAENLQTVYINHSNISALLS